MRLTSLCVRTTSIFSSWIKPARTFQIIDISLAPFIQSFFLAGLCAVPAYITTRIWHYIKCKTMKWEFMDFWTWNTELAAIVILAKALIARSVSGFIGGVCGLIACLHLLYFFDSDDRESYPQGVVSRTACFTAWQSFRTSNKKEKIITQQTTSVTNIEKGTLDLKDAIDVRVDRGVRVQKFFLKIKQLLKEVAKVCLLIKALLELAKSFRGH